MLSKLLGRLRSFLLDKLMTKRVIAIQLEKARIETDRKMTHVNLGLSMMASDGRQWSTLNVHYGSKVEMFMYNEKEMEMAQRDFSYISNYFVNQKEVSNGRKQMA